LKDGRVEQRNFDTYSILRLRSAPLIDVQVLESPMRRSEARANRQFRLPPPRLPMRCSRQQENASARCRFRTAAIRCETPQMR